MDRKIFDEPDSDGTLKSGILQPRENLATSSNMSYAEIVQRRQNFPLVHHMAHGESPWRALASKTVDLRGEVIPGSSTGRNVLTLSPPDGPNPFDCPNPNDGPIPCDGQVAQLPTRPRGWVEPPSSFSSLRKREFRVRLANEGDELKMKKMESAKD